MGPVVRAKTSGAIAKGMELQECAEKQEAIYDENRSNRQGFHCCSTGTTVFSAQSATFLGGERLADMRPEPSYIGTATD